MRNTRRTILRTRAARSAIANAVTCGSGLNRARFGRHWGAESECLIRAQTPENRLTEGSGSVPLVRSNPCRADTSRQLHGPPPDRSTSLGDWRSRVQISAPRLSERPAIAGLCMDTRKHAAAKAGYAALPQDERTAPWPRLSRRRQLAKTGLVATALRRPSACTDGRSCPASPRACA
jgi:hypothetical protein